MALSAATFLHQQRELLGLQDEQGNPFAFFLLVSGGSSLLDQESFAEVKRLDQAVQTLNVQENGKCVPSTRTSACPPSHSCTPGSIWTLDLREIRFPVHVHTGCLISLVGFFGGNSWVRQRGEASY